MKKVFGILFSLLAVGVSVYFFGFIPEIGIGLAFALPTCPTGCTSTLAPVEFDECAPETNGAQIAKIYVTNIGNPLTDWTDPAEWATRLDNDALTASDILTLHVVGSKPVPTGTEKEISLGRKVVGKKTHILNFKIDETNLVNHEFLRQNECGGSYLFWYETLEGKLFGSTDGIIASMLLDMNIAESADELIVNEGKFEWKDKFTEERISSPLA